MNLFFRNNIDDIVQVQYLAICSKLTNLTLDGNPICTAPCYDEEGAVSLYLSVFYLLLIILTDMIFELFETKTNHTVGSDVTVFRPNIVDRFGQLFERLI